MVKSFRSKMIAAIGILVLIFVVAYPVMIMAAPTGSAAFTSFNADRTTINAGQAVTFSIQTVGAQHVFANVGGVTIPATVTSHINATPAQTIWTLTVSPTISQTIRVYANNSNTTVGAAVVSVPITVAGAQVTPQPIPQPVPQPIPQPMGRHRIYSITETEAPAANMVTLTIVTDSVTAEVWLNERDRYHRGVRVSQTSTQNTWEITYRPSQYAPHTVTVSANHAYVADHLRSFQNFEVRLIAPFVPPASPNINTTRANPSTIDEGDRTTISIRTNLDVEFVWAQIDGNRVNARLENTTANHRDWTIEARPNRTQNIRVYANTVNETAGADRSTVRVTVRDRRQNPRILNSRLTRNDIWRGESTTIEVRTNTETTHVWAIVDGSRRNATLDRTRNNEREWSINIRPDREQNIRIYANTSNTERNADTDSVRVRVRRGYHWDDPWYDPWGRPW